MDLILNKEQVFVNEIVYDGQAEQGVEFDYVLPDYYPDIFRILKCSLCPRITSYNVAGDKLNFDGVVYIKVLYLCESSNKIHCVDQRMTFSKSVDLGKNVEDNNPQVSIVPKVDYSNCRAISERRLDIRGAISCKIKVCATRSSEILSQVDGDGIQAKTESLTYSGKKLNCKKQFTTREDIEVSTNSEGIANILHFEAVAVVTDYKVIPGKVVIKGEAQIKALYTLKSDDELGAEVMEAAIPLSQIIDADGISDEHSTLVEINITNSDLSVKRDDSDTGKIFTAEIVCECIVTAQKEEKAEIISDVYSVDYETEFSKGVIKLESLPHVVTQPITQKAAMEITEGELETTYDAWAEIINSSCKVRDDGEIVVTAQLNCQLIGKLSDGTIVFVEKQIPVEANAQANEISTDTNIDYLLKITSVSFNVVSGSIVDLRIQLNLRCVLYKVKSVEVIDNVNVLKDKPKDKNNEYALRLYYASSGEDLWTIAKHYNTSIEAIKTENEIDDQQKASGGLLLIPII